MNKILTSIMALTIFINSVQLAYAHVVVKPAEVGIASWQTFSVGVPNEQDQPTTGVRLVIPTGLEHVSPNVKPGWQIQMKHGEQAVEGDDHSEGEAPVTEILWTGGSIPVGQRDEFVFSAKVPDSETTLQWKAYQTYQDGTIVAWDQDPQAQSEGESDFSKAGPYSQTKIINDLAEETPAAPTATGGSNNILSVAAIVMAGAALAMQLFGKK